MSIKMGIIGYGNMGTTHSRNIAEGKVPGMELAAICDCSEERARVARETHPSVPFFKSAYELMKSGTCTAVLIAVPHYDHPGMAQFAFECGLDVLIEKPAGVYTKQVIEMNEAAEKSDKLFGIMYNQRTNPMYQKVRSMIQNGELGTVKRVSWTVTDWYRPQSYHDSAAWRSTWATEGGGTLINQNPHQIDLWQWMFGMPDKITSFVSFGKYYDIEVEDDVTAVFEYKNGMCGTYITSTGEAPGTNRLEIACDMGKIVVENEEMVFYRNVISEREHNRVHKSAFGKPECHKCEIPAQGSGEQHVGILKDFVNAKNTGKALLAPGSEGVLGLTISNAIHLSAWKGETIDVNNFPHDEFYAVLQEKIKNSTVDKSSIVSKISDTEGTY